MTDDTPTAADLEDLEARFQALNRARIDHRDRVAALEERVAELEELVDPDPGATAYEMLTRPQKVHHVRKKLVEMADRQDGKAQLKYRDVKMLFDGYPSAGHCYDLMERAADLDGYAYDEAGGSGEKRIRVNLADVNDDTLVHVVNNAPEGMEA